MIWQRIHVILEQQKTAMKIRTQISNSICSFFHYSLHKGRPKLTYDLTEDKYYYIEALQFNICHNLARIYLHSHKYFNRYNRILCQSTRIFSCFSTPSFNHPFLQAIRIWFTTFYHRKKFVIIKLLSGLYTYILSARCTEFRIWKIYQNNTNTFIVYDVYKHLLKSQMAKRAKKKKKREKGGNENKIGVENVVTNGSISLEVYYV